jgi:hypothetical protein
MHGIRLYHQKCYVTHCCQWKVNRLEDYNFQLNRNLTEVSEYRNLVSEKKNGILYSLVLSSALKAFLITSEFNE